ncbi:T9SS type A sorting domain-containing protein [Algibacter sp. 2305UL17-15]|uniref:T9SS type A sorting domain-containing protein n=1 Tax=Algibacter sp. 2305UL17-15 TaxID=3231268 RepID=UPI003459F478
MVKKYILGLLFFPIIAFSQPGTESAVLTINSTLTHLGFGEATAHAGTAEYKIYYDNIDGVLDKPIFILDGFDPGDSRGITTLFNSFNNAGTADNIVEEVRDEGYDLIIVNFPSYTSSTDGSTLIDGGADFIQRNAFSVIALLQLINGMTPTTNENVVIGASMGGLIARYALRYMEQNNMTHDTRLYISFDSPHQGANIPISIQYLFNYLVNGPLPQAAFQSGLDNLNSAAAKQMLVDHYLAHVGGDGVTQTGSNLPKGAPDFRDAFQSELDAMGFPQTVRNVAMINGSGLGATSGSPGANIINHTFFIAPVSIAVNLNFAPAATQTNIATSINFGLGGFTANAESPSFTDGVDSAPGGTTDLSSLDGDGSNPTLNEFVANLNETAYCFIPTVSSLAMSSTNNWYALPDNTTPFANTYIPDVNEGHVMVTNGNVAFALSEIREENLSNTDFLAEQRVKLSLNPIEKSLVLLNRSSQTQAKISIVDITGKLVFQNNTALQEHTTIPLSLSSGVYILDVKAENVSLLKTKLVVK